MIVVSVGALVIGGSAGAVATLRRLVADLPADLGACVLVTVHLPPTRHSHLPRILTWAGPLPARSAVDGLPLQPNTITVAPPNRHLLIEDGRAHLGAGPKVKHHRPSVDVMFGSAADWAGPGVVAVVLSGLLDDGAAGAAMIAQAGGTVLVQDPAEAPFPDMPRAALAAAPTARAIPITRMAATLSQAMALREEGVGDPLDAGT